MDYETFHIPPLMPERRFVYRTKESGGAGVNLRLRRCNRVAVEQQFNAQFTPPARHDKTVLSVSCQGV